MRSSPRSQARSSGSHIICSIAGTIQIEPTCYLQDLFTAEASRGQGAGRALIEAVYERAGAAGSSRVYWHTHETNLQARQLYDKLADNTGFRPSQGTRVARIASSAAGDSPAPDSRKCRP